MYVCLFDSLLPIKMTPLRSAPTCDQYDPESALMHNSFTLTVC